MYEITGNIPVEGNIHCLGAKNFSTKAMVAALLGDSPTILKNFPLIGDTKITEDMLTSIGVSIFKEENSITIDPSTINSSTVLQPHSGSNRIPILLLGTLLHRFDEVYIPMLGGCEIGARKVDFHVNAIKNFGAIVEETEDGFVAKKRTKLIGTHISLPYPSVGATETCLFLSVLAKGTSIINNIAIEPEIMELIKMLRLMGAIIYVNPNRQLKVEGVSSLSGTFMNILGDRIEAASWACLAIATKGDITVSGIDISHLGNFLSYYREAGGSFNLDSHGNIRFFYENTLNSMCIETNVYPGFSTDWQQPFAIMLTQAIGLSVIHETVYENRFGYLSVLQEMGANITITKHALGNLPNRFKDKNHDISAVISGPTNLVAIDRCISIPDLRAGLAYVISAAIAEGITKLSGIEKIERGYGDIKERLHNTSLIIKKI